LRAAHPGQTINIKVSGDLRGLWDGFRLQQVLANLVTNALKYGEPGAPFDVTAIGDGGKVRFEVTNRGPAIKESVLDSIFDPLTRGVVEERPGMNGNLGLGLFIARQIAQSHGGDIRAVSGQAQTVFSVSLPPHCEPKTGTSTAVA
jgi:signal transduction histidine kinase